MNKKTIRLLVLGGSVIIVAAGTTGVAVGGLTDPPSLGRSAASDVGTRTVAAVPATTAESSTKDDAANARQPDRVGHIDIYKHLGLLRRAATSADQPSPRAIDPISSLDGVQVDHARFVPVVRGADPFWLVPSDSTGEVFLASDDRVAGYSVDALENGRLLRVDESIKDRPDLLVVSGVLPDGVSDVRIATNIAEQTVEIVDNVYSLQFGSAAGSQPRVLKWRYKGHEHQLPVPLSPDVRKGD